jgi:hypothetical protein
MKDISKQKALPPTVLSLAELLEQQPPTPPPSLVEPGLLPSQGIWFVGGEPKVGKSLLVANLALALAAGSSRIGFPVPTSRHLAENCTFLSKVLQQSIDFRKRHFNLPAVLPCGLDAVSCLPTFR